MFCPKHSRFPPKKTSISEKLCETNQVLAHLCKQKDALQERIQSNLKDIDEVKMKIDTVEDEVERFAEEKMAGEMKAKLWNEIASLKKERQQTVRHLHSYRNKLKRKFKEYKALSRQLL